jgi:acyl-coenzyme A thioesterase PaaI-like protein
MKMSYMRSVKAVPLVGDGRVVHRGGSVIFMEGSLTAEDGSLVATATATGRVVRAAGSER